MNDWSAVEAAISAATRQTFRLSSHKATSGGYINQCYRIGGQDGRQFFLKLNDARRHAMFSSEAAGLEALAATRTLRVPRVITHGVTDAHSFLVLEHLELHSQGNARLLGEQLAALHRCTSTRFGFAQNNYIGTTAQPNTWTDDWLTFWREQRLGFQLRLTASRGVKLQASGEKLLQALPALFDGHTPQPSLLHGDLWSGNHAHLADGTPVIFDPTCYYGDRECDLAMTELFGGYPAAFYDAYRAAYPLDAGYPIRRELYNLYHILNHANMFGGSYVGQAEQMMRKLLAETQ